MSEAEDLWVALDLRENQQVLEAVLIAKVSDFDTGITSISMSNTDGVDWIDQVGLIGAAKIIISQAPIEKDDQ